VKCSAWTISPAERKESSVSEALQRLPFENRWTSGEKARHWYQQLEREGVRNVRLRQAIRDVNSDEGGEDAIPNEFVLAWLDYHTRESERRAYRWRGTMLVIVLVGAIAAIVAAWYSVKTYRNSDAAHPRAETTGQTR
jgi:hypothetical protein